MESIKRRFKGRYWRKVLTYFLTCCMFLNTSLSVTLAKVVLQPDGVIRGDITVSPLDGGTIQNMTASDGSIGHFSDFDIAAGNSVNCVQPTSDSSALFRIFSGDGTQIFGQFDANGHIYLVDPAGIFFGAGSQINVTRLVASGLNMTDAAYDTIREGGQMEFAGGGGNVTNQGIINADSVYLIGEKVRNLGPIFAPGGLVVMAAGDEVRLAQDGSNVSIVASEALGGIGNPDVRNSNNIFATNGKIVLAAGDTFSRAISNVSILAASGGEISVQGAIVHNNGYMIADASTPDGDAGSISLIGTEEVTIGPDKLGNPSRTTADAGLTGNGGTITIESPDGKVTIQEDSLISAGGGSDSGGGGTVTVTGDDFEIASDIFASPGNKTEEPGKLIINSPTVTIADGANAAATDTLYEEDIEALSQAATSLVVNASESIIVQDITDNEITGQFGDIQLLAAKDNLNSFVSFDDTSDTIRTTLGDIVIEAGGQGMNIGNLTTGKDLTDEKPTPGKIFLTSGTNTISGDITTGDLTIRDGWGTAEIDVKSSGNLTVNGDVIVGSESDILNVADQKPAEALVTLKADKDVKLDGVVEAHAYGVEDDTSTTKAYIDVIAGDNATMNDDLLATATSSASGTADAVITVEAAGDVFFAEGAQAHAIANGGEAEAGPGTVSEEETSNEGHHAQIIINDSATFLVDDNFSTGKSASIEIDVLSNDTLEEGDTIESYDIDPADGSLTEIEDNGNVVGFIYNPPEDLSTLTFDENGEAVVSFTYTVNGKTATVTMTLTNGLPVAIDDLATATQNLPVNINVLINDTDPDAGDALTPIEGIVTPKNGTLVLNENGTFTYTPDEGFLGDDSFTYSITDGYNTSSEVTVKITVSEKPVITYPTNLPPAPGLDSIGKTELNISISGNKALAKWVAKELGIDEKMVDIRLANSLASPTDIQPYQTFSKLRKAAIILQDADGIHINALAQVVNEFASNTAPPTEEQITAIADAITRATDEDSAYAIANEYVDALVTYVDILSNEIGFTTAESIRIVTDKYVGRLAQGQNVGVAAFIAASLAALGG